jgi:hypothetical protein
MAANVGIVERQEVVVARQRHGNQVTLAPDADATDKVAVLPIGQQSTTRNSTQRSVSCGLAGGYKFKTRRSARN